MNAVIRSIGVYLLAFLAIGTLVGASTMFPIMYNVPLTDYTVQGIQAYTADLWGLGFSIFAGIFNVINNIFRPIIDLLWLIVEVIQNIFEWLGTGLSTIISFFGGVS